MAEHYRSEQHQTAVIAFICRDALKFTSDQHDRGSRMDVETFSHITTSLPR